MSLREVLALNVVEVAVFHRGEDGMKRYAYLDTAELHGLVEQLEAEREKNAKLSALIIEQEAEYRASNPASEPEAS